jgi:hypothetical protein
MKKAFDQNVSRAKPRVRLGAALSEISPVEAELDADLAPANEVPAELPQAELPIPDLGAEVRARAAAASAPKPTAAQAIQRALEPTRAAVAAPPEVVEVQTPAAPEPPQASPPQDLGKRRERLKERLRAVRENPRPEPLPATAAQAGQMAVERISSLQGELTKMRQANLGLTQELEAARRQATKATEEARLRMDEARHISNEMESRAKLMGELEKELEQLEAERDESLLHLQESRQALDAANAHGETLKAEIQKRDEQLKESLVEEERLAAEVEAAKQESSQLRRAVDTVTQERDSLAKQVSQLTNEVAELLQARKALEQVHRALSHAAVR